MKYAFALSILLLFVGITEIFGRPGRGRGRRPPGRGRGRDRDDGNAGRSALNVSKPCFCVLGSKEF